MIDLVAASIRRMHRLYASFPKGLWGLCVSVLFVSIAFGLFAAMIVTYIAWKLLLIDQGFIGSQEDFFMVNLYWDGSMRISSFTLLALGLFGMRMRQVGDGGLPDIKAGSIWNEVGAAARSTFAWSLIILLALHVLLFRDRLDAHNALNATFWPDEPFHPSLARQYLNWLYTVARLVLNYLPYLMVLHMALAHDGVRIGMKTIKEHLPVIGAVLVLATVLDALFNQCYHLFTTYVFPPLVMPFGNSAFTYLFPFMVVLMFTAWTVPAICIAMTGPFDAFKTREPVKANAPDGIADHDGPGVTPP